ncbi:Uncharacterised protein [uncultured Eubacterium sp.]|nr:Uncharacterised protein [uncultured Eubacterium sp.]
MWNKWTRRTKNVFKYKVRLTGIAIIAILNIGYLIHFIRTDCSYFGGYTEINFTSFILIVLSEQHFLTFMVPLSIIYGVSEMNRVRLTEILVYKERNRWDRLAMISGVIYSLGYFLFLISAITAIAKLSGINFTHLMKPCNGMEFIIPYTLQNSETVDMVSIAIANVGNVLLYCVTLGILYHFLLCITKRRTGAVLLEIFILIIILLFTKSLMRWTYPYTFLGNVIPNVGADKLNLGINWIYWIFINLAFAGLTIFRNRKREYDQDE